MLKKALLGFVVILTVFLIFVAIQPENYRISREVQINAPAEVVFAQVNDLQQFNVWNPWAKLDPNSKMTFEGPKSGVGAKSIWNGNQEVGSGQMTIVESQPNALIRLKMEYFKPFQGTSEAEFAFKSENEKTTVTWSNSGKSNFFARMICVFMNMDKMMGGMFEKGLAQLKAVSESSYQSQHSH